MAARGVPRHGTSGLEAGQWSRRAAQAPPSPAPILTLGPTSAPPPPPPQARGIEEAPEEDAGAHGAAWALLQGSLCGDGAVLPTVARPKTN